MMQFAKNVYESVIRTFEIFCFYSAISLRTWRVINASSFKSIVHNKLPADQAPIFLVFARLREFCSFSAINACDVMSGQKLQYVHVPQNTNITQPLILFSI